MNDSRLTLALTFLLCIVFALGCVGSHPDTQTSPNTITKTSPDFTLLEVKPIWKKGGFGSIALWQVTFHNNSKRSIGNIKYRTAYLAETGAVVGQGGADSLISKDTVQKVIMPGERRMIEINDGFISDEAHNAGFEVVSWEYLDVPQQVPPTKKK